MCHESFSLGHNVLAVPEWGITLFPHGHHGFPMASSLAHSASCFGWNDKWSWTSMCRDELLSESGLRLGVKQLPRARISYHKANWRNRLQSKHKH